MAKAKAIKRSNWQETLVHLGKWAPEVAPRLARTTREMSKNLELLEELRRVCYPSLLKGIRMNKRIVIFKKGKH